MSAVKVLKTDSAPWLNYRLTDSPGTVIRTAKVCLKYRLFVDGSRIHVPAIFEAIPPQVLGHAV